MAKVPAAARHNTISIVRFITLPFCLSCMGDGHPDHDIHVSVPGNNLPVYPSDFPVSDICFRLCTLFVSLRGAFARFECFAFDSQLSEKLYGAVKYFSVKTVMSVVSVPVGSNETLKMENSEVLRNSTLGNFKTAGNGVHAEGFVINKKSDDPEPAFNAQYAHKLSQFLKSTILSFHRSPFQYISIY